MEVGVLLDPRLDHAAQPALVLVPVAGTVGDEAGQNGSLLRGAHGTAGELGHRPVSIDHLDDLRDLDRQGKRKPVPDLPALDPQAPCPRCKEPGHLEAYITTPALVDRVIPEAAADPAPDRYIRHRRELMKRLGKPAGRGDPAARRAVEDAARLLARTAIPLIHFVDPSHVVVSGALRQAGDHLLEPLKEELEEHGGFKDGVPTIVASAG